MGRIVVWAALSLLLTVVFLATPTAAQVPEPEAELDVTAHGEPIVPLTELATASFTLTVTCETGTLWTSEDPVAFTLTATVDVDWAIVAAVPANDTMEIDPADCAAGDEDKIEGDVQIALTAEAPAGDTFTVTLTAESEEEIGDETEWEETAGLYMSIAAAMDEPEDELAPGDTTTLELTVDNNGNTGITVSFALGDEPELLNVTLPDTDTISAGESATFEVEVLALSPNGVVDEEETLQIEVEAVAAEDSDVTDQMTVSSTFEVRGGETEDSPGPGVALMLGALGLVLLVRRRTA